MLKIKLRSILFVILLSLPVIPMYNRLLTHARPDRYSFNFKTLLLEYTLVLFLFFLLIIAVNSYKKNKYGKHIMHVAIFSVLICISTFFSTILSLDTTRSLYLYMFGILGPISLFFLIAFYLPANKENLDVLLKGFLSSILIYLLISFFYAARTLSFGDGIDLLELRIGGNIYGSNSVIGIIALLFPLVFVKNNFSISDFNNRSLQIKLFSVLSIIWIILAVSRWGFAVLVFAYLISTILINKKINLKIIIGVLIAFSLASYLVGNITDVIINRFTGGQELAYENIVNTASEETRFVRWENAFIYIKENILFGIGLGNNYLIDVRQSPEAHNLLINFTVERGIVTLFTLLGLVLSVIKLNNRVQKYSNNYVLKRHSKTLVVGIVIFFFWSLTAGSFIQAGGIISAVRAYYFMVAIALLVLISRVDGGSFHNE